MTNVVLVDDKDDVIGQKEKFSAHKIPVQLHRAISIVIFNKDRSQMLITKRARVKPTWPSFWSNAVCSHPLFGESYQDAADRRLFEELGFKTKLTEAFNFIYSAEMENKIWGENELDHVFVGEYEGDIKPDENEVEVYRWIYLDVLKKDILDNPTKYTPWFKIILTKLDKDQPASDATKH
jgi:isopentenyl-diphosphate delta-isomerase